jgi:2-haloacid dehalogenase
LPHHADKIELIEAFGKRFEEMIAGPIDGAVDVLSELKRNAVPLYAITNWSAETFPSQRERFEFLAWFEGIVVSGMEGVMKPDPRIFRILCERYRVAPESAVFIDDVPANADAACALGIHGIHFRSPDQLRRELVAIGMLAERS